MVKDRGRKIVEKKAQALQHLTVEYVPINSIKPNAYNPNRQSEHEYELLKRSMEEDGFTQPILVQKVTREIVDGFHRWSMAKTLGFTEIPVVFVDMTPEQMRIATLRHNRARGSEDLQLTAEVLRELESLGALDWAQDSLMMDDLEIQRLIHDIPAPEALGADEYGQAWVPEKVFTNQEGGTMGMEADEFQPGFVQAASARAAVTLREREARLKTARSEEEKAQIRKDSDVFRLALVFEGNEAAIIRRVLGAHPAQKIVEMCTKEYAEMLP